MIDGREEYHEYEARNQVHRVKEDYNELEYSFTLDGFDTPGENDFHVMFDWYEGKCELLAIQGLDPVVFKDEYKEKMRVQIERDQHIWGNDLK